MHDPLGAHDLAAEGLADRLVAEAHAEDRHAAGELAISPQRTPASFGRAGPRRDHDVRRRERRDLVDA